MLELRRLLAVVLLCPLLSNCLLEFQLNLIRNDENNNQPFNTLNEYIEGSLLHLKDNDLFTVPLTLGTPPQSFNVLLDTGSFILWVSSTKAYNEFHLPHRFDPSVSISYKSLEKKFEQRYVTGRLTGVFAVDSLSAYQKELPLMWGLGEETHARISCDGIIGMDHQYLSKYGFNENMSLMHQLIKKKVITQNIFSVKRNETHVANSRLFIGGYHDDFNATNEKTASCPLVDSAHWVCLMSHMVVGNSSVGNFIKNAIEANVNAIIDTGTNRIIAPYRMMEPVKNLLPSSCRFNCDNEVYCVFYCSDFKTAPDISLVFGGKSFRISKASLYYFDPTQVYVSYILFMKTDERPELLIGMPFFYNLHIAFDNENQQMKFYAKDKENVVDVSQFMNSKSNVFKNPWVIVSIAIGSALLVAGLVFLIVYLIKKNRDKAYESDVETIKPIFE